MFLSSDGLDDCFPTYRNEEYLYKFYRVLVETALEKGNEALFDELAYNALAEMSAKGSHDDISLGIMLTNREILEKACREINLPQNGMEEESVEERGECDA